MILKLNIREDQFNALTLMDGEIQDAISTAIDNFIRDREKIKSPPLDMTVKSKCQNEGCGKTFRSNGKRKYCCPECCVKANNTKRNPLRKPRKPQ